MDIHLVNKYYDDGTLKAMHETGFLSAKIFLYRDIYIYVDSKIKEQNISQEKATLMASVQFSISRRTVYKAIYKLKPKN